MGSRNPLSVELAFTEVYRQHTNVSIREAMCLKTQYPHYLGGIQAGDLFAGRINHGAIGFSPDEWGQTAFGYYCIPHLVDARLENADVDEDYRRKVQEMLEFWQHENTSSRVRAAYPEAMVQALPSDNWMGEPGIAFPLYRLTGANVDFGKLLTLGIPGLVAEVKQRKQQAGQQEGAASLYEGMLIALDVLVDACLHYARDARRRDLPDMAAVLEQIALAKPETFREAIQLMWIYSIVSDVRNYGRMDVYLGDFLAQDLATQRLDKAEALRLLQSLWQLMACRNTVVHGRVIIGGLGRPNEKNADEFALLAIEATRRVREPEPQLSLRFYQGMNPLLMERALDVIGEARTFPILYNDDVNVSCVENALQVSPAEAKQYVPFGCGEYIIDHRSFGTPSGVINLLKALEVTIHNGVDPVSGKSMGLALGEFNDFETFEELWEAYKQQVEYFVEIMAKQQEIEYAVAGKTASHLYLSMLYDDCLERGKSMFAGGVHYLGGTLETYGNTNTVDSLMAIKDLVYDTKHIAPDELLAALDGNFEGHERIRQMLLKVPKYGNDDERVDTLAAEVHNHVCNFVQRQKERTKLHSYAVVIINNSANTLMGRWTAASADGRKASTSMANGNAPSSGSDQNGVTAFLNSIVKLDPSIHAGAVQNMKFSRELFETQRAKIEDLLGTYFANGGAQSMINVVSRKELENALVEPEKHRDLIVRVGGFSARFVELSRDVQIDILNRTLY